MNLDAHPLAAPQATLRDVAVLNAAHRAAWTLRNAQAARRARRRPAAPDQPPAPGVAASVAEASRRRSHAAAALRRLAVDPAATPAERALAAERAALLEARAC